MSRRALRCIVVGLLLAGAGSAATGGDGLDAPFDRVLSAHFNGLSKSGPRRCR